MGTGKRAREKNMTNADIRIIAREMVRQGKAATMMQATHQILAQINAEANAQYRLSLPAADQ